MNDDKKSNGSITALYGIALAIALGGGALGYAWGLAQLLAKP